MTSVARDTMTQYYAAPGPYGAWATSNGTRAEVRVRATGTRVQEFRGETAWSDAVRAAEDRNNRKKENT